MEWNGAIRCIQMLSTKGARAQKEGLPPKKGAPDAGLFEHICMLGSHWVHTKHTEVHLSNDHWDHALYGKFTSGSIVYSMCQYAIVFIMNWLFTCSSTSSNISTIDPVACKCRIGDCARVQSYQGMPDIKNRSWQFWSSVRVISAFHKKPLCLWSWTRPTSSSFSCNLKKYHGHVDTRHESYVCA